MVEEGRQRKRERTRRRKELERELQRKKNANKQTDAEEKPREQESGTGRATEKRKKIKDNDITGLKYFDQLSPLLSRLHEVGCERDKVGNRELHYVTINWTAPLWMGDSEIQARSASEWV